MRMELVTDLSPAGVEVPQPAAHGNQFLMSLADQAVASANNFLTGIIIGRSCSKQDFGIYMMGYSAILFLVTVQNTLLGSPYTIRKPRLKPSELAIYTGSTVLHQVAFSLLVAAAIALFGLPFAYPLGNRQFAPLVWTLMLAVPLLLTKEFLRRLCFANLRPAAAFILDCGVLLLQSAGLVFLARHALLGPASAFLIMGLVCACLIVPFVILHRGWARIDFACVAGDFHCSWQIGRWVSLSGFLWAGCIYCCPWLIAALNGPEKVGVWAACFGITAFINPVLLGMQNYIEPRVASSFAKHGAKSMQQTINRSALCFGGLMIGFSALLFFFGNHLAIFIYGSKYAGNGTVIFTISLASVLGAIGYPFSCGLFAIGNARLDSRVNLAYPVAILTLGIPLTKMYGPLGAAAGLLLAHFAALALRVQVSKTVERNRTVQEAAA